MKGQIKSLFFKGFYLEFEMIKGASHYGHGVERTSNNLSLRGQGRVH
jgi:hypothetical protein